MRFASIAAHAAFLFFSAFVLAHSSARAADAEREALAIATGAGERDFTVEIADDDRERARGLMFRRSMPDDEGMLFDFLGEEPASFWMRNTYIPLDMLFIKADGTIELIAAAHDPALGALGPLEGTGPLCPGDQRRIERQARHRAGRQGVWSGDGEAPISAADGERYRPPTSPSFPK